MLAEAAGCVVPAFEYEGDGLRVRSMAGGEMTPRFPHKLMERAFVLANGAYGWRREDACEVARWLVSQRYVITGGEAWTTDLPLDPISSDPTQPDPCAFFWHWDFDPAYQGDTGDDVARSLAQALRALNDSEQQVEQRADPAVRDRIRYLLSWWAA